MCDIDVSAGRRLSLEEVDDWISSPEELRPLACRYINWFQVNIMLIIIKNRPTESNALTFGHFIGIVGKFMPQFVSIHAQLCRWSSN